MLINYMRITAGDQKSASESYFLFLAVTIFSYLCWQGANIALAECQHALTSYDVVLAEETMIPPVQIVKRILIRRA